MRLERKGNVFVFDKIERSWTDTRNKIERSWTEKVSSIVTFLLIDSRELCDLHACPLWGCPRYLVSRRTRYLLYVHVESKIATKGEKKRRTKVCCTNENKSG